MLTHIVLFDFTDPADAEEVAVKLREMAPKIPEIQGLEVGHDVVRSDRSYQLGLIVRLADREALQTYAAHPEHTPVLEFIKARVARSAAVDFES